jgi:gluconolactonase
MKSDMKRILQLAFFVLFVGLVGELIHVDAQAQGGSSVIKLDPSLDELISTDARLETLRNDFGNTEGPNWVQKGKTGYLIFTDIAANVIYKMTADGKAAVLVDHAGYQGLDPWNVSFIQTNRKDPKDPGFREYYEDGPDGLTLDRQGRIIVCTYVGRSIVRIEKNGTRTVLADKYEGKSFSGPNDVIVKRDGTIYFSDTTGGIRGRGHDPKEELAPRAIYMIKNGKVTIAIGDIPTPNGLAFSPDEKYLYANGSGANYIRRYEVQSDDTVTNGKLLIDLTVDKSNGITDGMRIDAKGNIWSSGPGGVWIISPEGKHLGTISVPSETPWYGAVNVTFGDADYKTLYIAARAYIYKIRVKTPGNRVF